MIAVDLRPGPSANLVLVGGERPVLIDSGSGSVGSLARTRAFLAEHGAIVIKPLHGNGGKAIFKVESDGANLSALIEVFNMTWREPHMVQAFLPDVAKGDKRIVLVDGEVGGAINRLPGRSSIRNKWRRRGIRARGCRGRCREVARPSRRGRRWDGFR